MVYSYAMRPGPKPSVDETRFIPRTPEQEEMLLASLIDAQTGVVKAINIVNTLRDLDKYPRPLSNKLTTSLVSYRRRLQKLGAPPWEQDAVKALAPAPKSGRERGPVRQHATDATWVTQ